MRTLAIIGVQTMAHYLPSSHRESHYRPTSRGTAALTILHQRRRINVVFGSGSDKADLITEAEFTDTAIRQAGKRARLFKRDHQFMGSFFHILHMDDSSQICRSFGDKAILSREHPFVNRLVTKFLKKF
jgi:hypothetical protein